ncbi:MAG TPA: ABC transporter substrate-binding protein [Burkholderiales bacterium]|jgi:phospholipid transport system substrate-binding protein|nr:ABC transporter substrate-binding protein [Burkholderiales bacterium]
MFLRLLVVAGALAALASAPAARAQEMIAPDALVKNVTLEVVDILRKDKDISGDRKKLVALVDAKIVPHFNFTSMTASAVGTNWSKATPEQKTRLTDEFRTLMVRTYASSIAAFRDQKFDFRPLRAKPTDTDVTVNVRVIQPGSEAVKIDYEMEKTPRGWKVWDVRVADISLTANYRTEFANIVRDSGVDGLIKALQTKNAGPPEKPVAGAPAAASEAPASEMKKKR